MAAGNLDATNDVYIAKNGTSTLPVSVTLTGNSVNTNPAVLNARPGAQASGTLGNNVSGSDASTGTVYTVTLTENNALAATYPSTVAGTYTLSITANIARGD